MIVICVNCLKPFEKDKAHVNEAIKRNWNFYCSRRCQSLYKSQSKLVNCAECGKEHKKSISSLKDSKSGRSFCSQTCSARYNNKHKTTGNRRSKLEKELETFILSEFPDMKVVFNDKSIIGSELDIYIPSIKLGIEINGIFHYEPIFGSDKLLQIQNNDKAKLRACNEKNIDLVIIPNLVRYLNKTAQKDFKEQIKKIIISRL